MDVQCGGRAGASGVWILGRYAAPRRAPARSRIRRSRDRDDGASSRLLTSRRSCRATLRPASSLRVRRQAPCESAARWLPRSVALATRRDYTQFERGASLQHACGSRPGPPAAPGQPRRRGSLHPRAVAIVIASPTASRGGVSIRSTSHRFSSTANASATQLDGRNSPGSGGRLTDRQDLQRPGDRARSVACTRRRVERIGQRDAHGDIGETRVARQAEEPVDAGVP